MQPFCKARWYEDWAPVLGRILLGGLFLMGAFVKIPGTQSNLMEVGMSGAMGIPFPAVAVILAGILETVGGLMLIFGWKARYAAAILAPYTLLLALIFYRNFSDPTVMGEFISHLGLIAGLLYISVYGAHHAAVSEDDLPQKWVRR